MNIKILIAFVMAVFFAVSFRAEKLSPRTSLFDDDWRFHRGDVEGAEAVQFDDVNWRRVDLPHDWSIEDMPGTNSPFDANAISAVSGGFTTGGTSWYRKSFSLP